MAAGFFNANSAHPYENPNALTNFIQLISIFAIGAALTNVLGRMVKDERQGWAIFAAMGVLFLAGVTTAYWSEVARQSRLRRLQRRLGVERRRRPAATWKARRCGSASPTVGALRHGDDRHLVRRRQFHA